MAMIGFAFGLSGRIGELQQIFLIPEARIAHETVDRVETAVLLHKYAISHEQHDKPNIGSHRGSSGFDPYRDKGVLCIQQKIRSPFGEGYIDQLKVKI
jgi:hypothetical protein